MFEFADGAAGIVLIPATYQADPDGERLVADVDPGKKVSGQTIIDGSVVATRAADPNWRGIAVGWIPPENITQEGLTDRGEFGEDH